MTIGLIALGATFILGILLYPRYIQILKRSLVEQEVSEYALDEFKEKESTVTFGGLLFVVLPIVVTFIVSIKTLNFKLLLLMLVFLSYGVLGFVDDAIIIKEGKNDGLSAKMKLLIQLVIAVVFYVIYIQIGGDNLLHIPIINKSIDMGLLYFPFVVFMFAAYSNAVNLTDGMDGLASGTSIIAFIPYIIFAYQTQPELHLFLLAVVGGLLAFLFYNYAPAKIFMGDVGSLALGALFAVASVYLKMELLSLVIGGVFVYETVTVVIQQVVFRFTRKRVFKYTPIHYSFTISGWKESTVVHFFWILGLICAICGYWIGMI